jgi:CheY-like chemotaxis protein
MQIVVVDDEAIIAETPSQILTMYGHSVSAFSNPACALAYALNHPPDLLISDVMMPGLCGFELARHIGERLPACRILLFSALAGVMNDIGEDSKRYRSITVLQKPLAIPDLLSAMTAVCGTLN